MAKIITVRIEPTFWPNLVSPSLSPALPNVSKSPSSSSGFLEPPPKPKASRSSSEITEMAP